MGGVSGGSSGLTRLEHRRTGRQRQETVPCRLLPGEVVRTELFVGGRFEIHNALSASGTQRNFCTWSDQIGVVCGPSLQYPWARLRGRVEIKLAARPPLEVWGRRHRLYLRGGGLPSELRLTPKGIQNEVVLTRPDGTTLARFPALRRAFDIDLNGSTGDERLVVLAVLGSGLVRRARRGGLTARAGLPSAID